MDQYMYKYYAWLLNFVSENLDQRKDTYCVFFDLQKAFDTVPHRKLMCKLEKLHLHPVLLTWLHNYLYGREQNVVVNGETSDPVRVISGVPQVWPQGSVLGPLLFLIYIDDITSLQLYLKEQKSLSMQMTEQKSLSMQMQMALIQTHIIR